MNKKELIAYGVGVLFFFFWITLLVSQWTPGFIPCEWFADDVGYEPTFCSPFDILSNIGSNDIQLSFLSYLMGMLVFLSLPVGITGFVFWKRKWFQ